MSTVSLHNVRWFVVNPFRVIKKFEILLKLINSMHMSAKPLLPLCNPLKSKSLSSIVEIPRLCVVFFSSGLFLFASESGSPHIRLCEVFHWSWIWKPRQKRFMWYIRYGIHLSFFITLIYLDEFNKIKLPKKLDLTLDWTQIASLAVRHTLNVFCACVRL